MAALNEQYPLAMKTIPGFRYRSPGVQIGQYIDANCSDDDLRLMQQLGCEWAMVTGLDGGDEKEEHCAENYIRIKERFAAFDVQVYRIAHSRVHNVPEITLNQEGRDERINECVLSEPRCRWRRHHRTQQQCSHRSSSRISSRHPRATAAATAAVAAASARR